LFNASIIQSKCIKTELEEITKIQKQVKTIFFQEKIQHLSINTPKKTSILHSNDIVRTEEKQIEVLEKLDLLSALPFTPFLSSFLKNDSNGNQHATQVKQAVLIY